MKDFQTRLVSPVATVMKTKLLLLLGFWLGLAVVTAQDAPAPKDSAPTVVERGAHHRVWERVVYEKLPSGETVAQKHRYTEMGNGMHYRGEDGLWKESKEEIEVYPTGAIARQGGHKVIFANNLNTAGAIDMQTPDGKELHSHVLGLSYYDAASGKSALIAEAKDSFGQIVASNQVIYPDAFTDFAADVRYTYTKASFEQDVILKERPPLPEAYGLDSRTTRLQVLTEFLSPPAPVKTAGTVPSGAGELPDETLDFGAMKMVAGQAFALGAETTADEIRVGKQWLTLEGGRTVLCEEVAIPDVAKELDKLPLPAKAVSLLVVGSSARHMVSTKRLLPEPKPARAERGEMKLATLAAPARGLVLDYTTLTSTSDFTFQGNATYYLATAVNLSGTTTLEGGAVIKFAKGKTLKFLGPLVCQTAPYRMAVLTAKDDDSVGEQITGSTGKPSGFYALEAILFNPATAPVTLEYVRLAYASLGVQIAQSTGHVVRHCQFEGCKTAIYFLTTTGAVQNVLIHDADLAAFKCGNNAKASAEQVTVNAVNDLVSLGTLYVTNSLLISVTNWGAGTFSGVYNATNSAAGVFQTGAAGRHYLATNSAYRNAGTTNITTTLLASLKQKTTFPPLVYSNVTITNTMTFSPQAARDTEAPDLGYHYDPIDYAFGHVDVSADVTFTAGTVAAWFRREASWNHGGYGIHLTDRKICTFAGRVDAPCLWVRCNTAQELDNGNWYGVGGIVGWAYPYATNAPIVRARFTDFSILGGEWTSFTRDDSGFIKVELTDCRLWGGNVGNYAEAAYLTNCFFDRCGVLLTGTDPYALKLTMRNCTMRGGALDLEHWETGGPHWTASVRDCAFDGTAFYQTNPSDGDTNCLDFAYNAYLSGGQRLTPTNANDKVVTSFGWQTGTSGSYYLPTNSALINAGSMTNAGAVGLYHHTTTTNQVPETNSVVDLGYHSLALDPQPSSLNYQLPLDTDGDGVADYLEDTNGDGVYATNDVSDWSDYYNGVLPYLEMVMINRQCTVSNYLVLPLVIRATDSNAVNLVNAPLTFAVTNGTAKFSATTNGVQTTNFFLRTDSAGLATTWLFLPTNAVTTNYLTVTAISGTNQTQMQLVVWLQDPEGRFFTMQMDTNVAGIGLDSAGTMLWKNHNAMPHVPHLTCENCGGTCSSTNYGTTNWLCMHSLTNGQAGLTLHNTTNGFYYQLFSTTDIVNYYNISKISGGNWKFEQTRQATNTSLVFDPVPTNGNPRMFFWAMGAATQVKVEMEPYLPAMEPCAGNPASSGQYRFSREGPTDSALTIYYSMSGSADNGVDYTNDAGTNFTGVTTIPAGATFVALNLTPKAHGEIFDESAILTLLFRTNGNYVINPTNAAATITIRHCGTNNIFQVVTNLIAPIGIDYHPPTHSLIVSVDSFDGDTGTRFVRIDSNGLVSAWSGNYSNLALEVKLATVKATTNGFTNGQVFFGNNATTNRVGMITASGSSSNLNFAELTNDTHIRGGLYMDDSGSFGGDLIAVTGAGDFQGGGVWRINSSGTASLITNIGTDIHLEGVITLTNDVAKWGPWAGKIITGAEVLQAIYVIATNGGWSIINLGIAPEDFDLIPNNLTNQNLYCTTQSNEILKLSGSFFAGHEGELLITQAGEFGQPKEPRLFIVRWNNLTSMFETSYIRHDQLFEHVTFAPIYIPPQ